MNRHKTRNHRTKLFRLTGIDLCLIITITGWIWAVGVILYSKNATVGETIAYVGIIVGTLGAVLTSIGIVFGQKVGWLLWHRIAGLAILLINLGVVSEGIKIIKSQEDTHEFKSEVNEVAIQLKTGDKAVGFELLDQDGKTVKLYGFAGKKVLLYFYPKANTPGCTKQACSVRDSAQPLKDLGVVALGISPDEPDAQKKFDEKYSLGFQLLSDPNHKTAEAYGVWGEKSMLGKKYMGITRSSFLIDEQGKIIEAWYKVSPADTVPNALAAIQKK